MGWIVDNMATILVGIVVFSIIGLAAVKLIRDKKSKKSSCGCGCGCGGCSMNGICHSKKSDNTDR